MNVKFEVVDRPTDRRYAPKDAGLFEALLETASTGRALRVPVAAGEAALGMANKLRNRYVATLRRRGLFETQMSAVVDGSAVCLWMTRRDSKRRAA